MDGTNSSALIMKSERPTPRPILSNAPRLMHLRLLSKLQPRPISNRLFGKNGARAFSASLPTNRGIHPVRKASRSAGLWREVYFTTIPYSLQKGHRAFWDSVISVIQSFASLTRLTARPGRGFLPLAHSSLVDYHADWCVGNWRRPGLEIARLEDRATSGDLTPSANPDPRAARCGFGTGSKYGSDSLGIAATQLSATFVLEGLS